jgi:hypothetical protein
LAWRFSREGGAGSRIGDLHFPFVTGGGKRRPWEAGKAWLRTNLTDFMNKMVAIDLMFHL